MLNRISTLLLTIAVFCFTFLFLTNGQLFLREISAEGAQDTRLIITGVRLVTNGNYDYKVYKNADFESGMFIKPVSKEYQIDEKINFLRGSGAHLYYDWAVVPASTPVSTHEIASTQNNSSVTIKLPNFVQYTNNYTVSMKEQDIAGYLAAGEAPRVYDPVTFLLTISPTADQLQTGSGSVTVGIGFDKFFADYYDAAKSFYVRSDADTIIRIDAEPSTPILPDPTTSTTTTQPSTSATEATNTSLTSSTSSNTNTQNTTESSSSAVNNQSTTATQSSTQESSSPTDTNLTTTQGGATNSSQTSTIPTNTDSTTLAQIPTSNVDSTVENQEISTTNTTTSTTVSSTTVVATGQIEMPTNAEVVISRQPENGLVEIDLDGDWRYIPLGAPTNDSFVVEIIGPNGETSLQEITIDIEEIAYGYAETLPQTGLNVNYEFYLIGIILLTAGILCRKN